MTGSCKGLIIATNKSAHLGRSTETPADQDAVMFLKIRYKECCNRHTVSNSFILFGITYIFLATLFTASLYLRERGGKRGEREASRQYQTSFTIDRTLNHGILIESLAVVQKCLYCLVKDCCFSSVNRFRAHAVMLETFRDLQIP